MSTIDSDKGLLPEEAPSDLPARRPEPQTPITQEQLERVIRRASDLQFRSSTTVSSDLDAAEVVRIGDSFAMWYSGLNVIGQLVEIGYSVSPDGLHWGKWSGNPVLSPVSPCNAVDSIAVLIEGDTVYAWVPHCDDIYHATSPFAIYELVNYLLYLRGFRTTAINN